MPSITRRLVSGSLAAVPALALSPPAESQAARFAALDSGKTLHRVAIGSCNIQSRPQSHWGVIDERRPDLFLYCGDNVYGDLQASGPAFLAEAYRQLAGSAEFQHFAAKTPMLTVWDDHDYGVNDGDSTYVHKADSQRQFVEFWNLPPDDPRRRRPGVYHAVTFGPAGRRVQVILLDLRYFRSPMMRGYNLHRNEDGYAVLTDPSGTMLGDAQWRWLEQALLQPAEIRLIVSPIQVIGDGGENWKLLPLERRRLFDLIGNTRATGCIFVSGDTHTGALYRFNRSLPYPLYELTASALNQGEQPVRMEEAYLLGPVFPFENFGVIDIDWASGRLRPQIVDMQGSTVRHTEIDLSQLA